MDRNEQTREEIQRLLDKGDTDELESRLRNRIEFGTAGLRGKMEAGWARMNGLSFYNDTLSKCNAESPKDLIIIQASQGLCRYVMENVQDARSRGVVIGHDHRHNSERWAKLTAAAFINKGMKVYLHRGLVHTPLVPFSVKRLNASCGVMITASHNPKDDNGYKVYWENAVQIIEPHDKGISDAIKSNLDPQTWSIESSESSPDCLDVTQEMKDAYFTSLDSFRLPSYKPGTGVSFVNTSMHGVGHAFVNTAFERFGISFKSVTEQQSPNPDFPTVRYPNPEEKGALDLALATANRVRANYVLAQDPDADRFAAAEKQPNGEWATFTGDQLGVVFAGHVFDAYRASGKPVDKLAMVASTVSSKMVEAIAKREGFKFVDCLTGFKYIGNTALDLVRQGYEAPFGYEEAIGFMFGSEIRDKDGVAASVVFAQISTILSARGTTVKSYLNDLYARYGFFMVIHKKWPSGVILTESQTSNSYFICKDPATIDKIFQRIRNLNNDESETILRYPHRIAGLRVTSVIDLTTGYDSTNPPTYKPRLPLSSGHMIQFRAEREPGGDKIILTTRTSGTEPKIKYYLEGSGKDEDVVAKLLKSVVEELGKDWMEAEKNNLGRP
ncbi:hypothetical protein V5O48_012155 [Marasmius crinis-equi]|uniref:Phosphoglucomutase n=1 Tax=Marasmius crinis-equi TaxID=585013 RepID=A0ABR3F3Y3_9AGAR